jgi:hypothetical protein
MSVNLSLNKPVIVYQGPSILALPPELLHHIISFLPLSAYRAASLTCRCFNEIVILKTPKRFIDNLISYLDVQQEELLITRLLEEKKRWASQKHVDLVSLKKAFIASLEHVMEILSELSTERLVDLEAAVPYPRNVGAIFYVIIDLQKKFDEATDECPNSKYYAYQEVVTQVCNMGFYNKAVALAQRISDLRSRSAILEGVSMHLYKTGDIDRAVEMANRIPQNWYRNNALIRMANHLREVGNIDLAFKIMNLIHGDLDRFDICSFCFYAMSKYQCFDQVMEIANLMPEDGYRFGILKMVACKLAAQPSHIDRAIEIANLIPQHCDYRFIAFEKIIERLAQMGHIDRALEIAKHIPEYEDK